MKLAARKLQEEKAQCKGAVHRGRAKGMEVWRCGKMGKWETGSLKFMLFVKKMNFT